MTRPGRMLLTAFATAYVDTSLYHMFESSYFRPCNNCKPIKSLCQNLEHTFLKLEQICHLLYACIWLTFQVLLVLECQLKLLAFLIMERYLKCEAEEALGYGEANKVFQLSMLLNLVTFLSFCNLVIPVFISMLCTTDSLSVVLQHFMCRTTYQATISTGNVIP